MRRALPAAIFLLALAIAWWVWPPATLPPLVPPPRAGADSGTPKAPPATASDAKVRIPSLVPLAPSSPSPATPSAPRRGTLEEDFPIVAPLNRPEATIARDLETLQHVFDAWRSNFPRDGNPFGENADITAALTGENALGFALIPKDHPAINARGELCDRWGTPFRFHQLSGQRMEIRSAGPDRKFATDDDALWTPP